MSEQITGEQLEAAAELILNPEECEWEKEELLDQLSAHDSEWKISCSITQNRMVYSVEATGTYSLGELVMVSDIEVVNASGEGEL